jgi:hypothetical protein
VSSEYVNGKRTYFSAETNNTLRRYVKAMLPDRPRSIISLGGSRTNHADLLNEILEDQKQTSSSFDLTVSAFDMI